MDFRAINESYKGEKFDLPGGRPLFLTGVPVVCPWVVLVCGLELNRSGHQLNFFLSPFCENSLICLEGKSMTPHRGNTILFRSSQQLRCLPLKPLKVFLG